MLDIADYGAVADGKSDNTPAIQQAIDQAAASGGGTVTVGAGVWLTYTLFLKDNVTLHLEAGAVLLGGPDPLCYPEVPDNLYWIPGRCSRLNRRALIYALHCHNTAITGRGKIHGNAKAFTVTDERKLDLHDVWARKDDRLIPGRCLLFVGCTDVLLSDFMIEDSAGWCMWLLDCDHVQISRLRIDGDLRLPNMDGIHLSACRDATVSDCIIRSSDDAIVLRSHQEQLYQPKACERVTVSNCVIESGSSAVRIGWSNDYMIRDCVFQNLAIRNTFAGISIFIPQVLTKQFDPPRGPDCLPPPANILPFEVENLLFDNIVMETHHGPFMIRLADDACCNGIRNVRLSNITASACGYPFISAKMEHQVKDIIFDRCRFTIGQSGRTLEHYPEFSKVMVFDAAQNMQFNDVTFVQCITPSDQNCGK